jgi:hypothetical protein
MSSLGLLILAGFSVLPGYAYKGIMALWVVGGSVGFIMGKLRQRVRPALLCFAWYVLLHPFLVNRFTLLPDKSNVVGWLELNVVSYRATLMVALVAVAAYAIRDWRPRLLELAVPLFALTSIFEW